MNIITKPLPADDPRRDRARQIRKAIQPAGLVELQALLAELTDIVLACIVEPADRASARALIEGPDGLSSRQLLEIIDQPPDDGASWWNNITTIWP